MGTHPIFQSDFDCLTVCLCIVLSDPFWLRDRSFSAARSSLVWKPEVTPTLRRVTLYSPSTQHGTDTLEFLSALRRPSSPGYFLLMPTGTTVNSNRASSLAFLMTSLSCATSTLQSFRSPTAGSPFSLEELSSSTTSTSGTKFSRL